MSKKSRKRNKKILAALALAGGAALMARKGKGVAQGVSGSDKAAFTSDAAYKLPPKNWITKKVVAPVDTDSRFDTRFSKPHEEIISKGVRSRALQAAANAPTGIYPPGSVPMQRTGVHPRRPGIKKGGRVTGIAKRGFGRALMKGKK